MRPFLFFLCLFACSKEAPKPVEPTDPLDPVLVSKSELYLNLMVQDEHGFVDSDTCDSLLFTALTGTVPGTDISIRAARNDSGQWFRTPKKDCYPDRSASSISRDMILGLYWYAYSNRDLPLLNDLWDYGYARSWIMGDGLRNRTLLTPGMIATLAQLILHLGGEDKGALFRNFRVDWFSQGEGYEAHIQVLHIMLRKLIYNEIESTAQPMLEKQAARQPVNALFRLAVGDIDAAISTLKDEIYFPPDRLPSAEDRCSGWLWERDLGVDWIPCQTGRIHSGGDFLFVTNLIKTGLK